MSKCRCDDLEVIQADLNKLGEMEDIAGRMAAAIVKTDEATQGLKDAITGAAEVSLGGVPSNHFSQTGNDMLTSAKSSISSRKTELEDLLSQYQTEDESYHEGVRQAEARREELIQKQREEQQKQNQRGD